MFNTFYLFYSIFLENGCEFKLYITIQYTVYIMCPYIFLDKTGQKNHTFLLKRNIFNSIILLPKLCSLLFLKVKNVLSSY